MTHKEATLYCDGASSGNPGASGVGVVLICGDKTYEISENIGTATNNIAEYSALVKGLSKARSLNIEKVHIFLDSELLVRQVEGTYKVKSENLKKLYENVISQLKFFREYSIRHIPREQNKKADILAKRAVKTARESG